MKTLNEIMNTFTNSFEVRTRDTGENFTCLKDDAPEWVKDIVQECHGDMLPDDYIYQWLSLGSGALSGIDSGEWEDNVFEVAEGLVESYNGRLLQWLSSNLTRAAHIEDCVNDGLFDNAENFDLFQAIRLGQCREIEGVLATLVQQIEELEGELSREANKPKLIRLPTRIY